jgi:predicted nucleotidyltransferase
MSERVLAHLSNREQSAIQEFLLLLQQQVPGLVSVSLFGSKARGDCHAWSDVDILIVVREENWSLREQISYLAADISLEYDVLISPRLIGEERWDHMRREGFSFFQNIERDGVPLGLSVEPT